MAESAGIPSADDYPSPLAAPTPTDTFSATVAARESATTRLLEAGALSVVNLLLKLASTFVFISFALHYLGKSQYGLWIILQSIGSYLALSELGMGQKILNLQNAAYARGDYEEVNRTLTTAFGLYWLIVIPVWITSGLVLFTQPVASWVLHDPRSQAATLFAPYAFLFGTLTLFRVPLCVFPATLLGLREITLRQVAEAASWILLTIVPVVALVLGGRMLTLVLVTHACGIATSMGAYALVKTRHPEVSLGRCYWSPARLWPLFSQSLPLFLLTLALVFQRAAANLLAGKYGELHRVPELFVLVTLFRVVGWTLADNVSRNTQPYAIMFAVHGEGERVELLASLCTKLTFAVAVLFSVFVWFVGETGLTLWLGRGMFLGYGPLALLAGAFLIDVLFLSTNNFMLALDRYHTLSAVMVAYAVLSFVLGMTGAKGIPTDPLYGICLGFFVASAAQVLILPWVTRAALAIPLRRYLSDFLLRPTALFAAAAVLIALQEIAGRGSLLAGWAAKLAALAMLAVGAWFVFDAEERRLLRERFQSLRMRRLQREKQA